MEVEDTGYGIPEDIREKIFDPFFTTKGDDGGTVLGLSVVHGIVERFGGTIQIESEVDQGSTFRITLPPVPDGEVATQEPTSGEDIASLRGSNQLILLVEDENEVRKGLTEMLTILGYRVEAVDRIASAREAISGGEFDLLVTDMVLPDGSGADLIKELRAIHPEVPVIAMSGYTTETPGLEAIAAGELRFIQKPFGLDEVAREVRSALETAVV
jgi:CheY-like chemotaxis protein